MTSVLRMYMLPGALALLVGCALLPERGAGSEQPIGAAPPRASLAALEALDASLARMTECALRLRRRATASAHGAYNAPDRLALEMQSQQLLAEMLHLRSTARYADLVLMDTEDPRWTPVIALDSGAGPPIEFRLPLIPRTALSPDPVALRDRNRPFAGGDEAYLTIFCMDDLLELLSQERMRIRAALWGRRSRPAAAD